MYIGHVATALAAKKFDGTPSLGTYTIAAFLPDMIFSVMLFGKWEEVVITPGHTAMMPMAFPHYPYSHSLLGTAIAGLILGGAYWLRHRRLRSAAILFGLAVGHWVLDVISHAPDVPLGFNGPNLGLGLWDSVTATFLVEGSLFALGAVLYCRTTEPVDRIGRWALVGLIGFLLLTYLPGPFSEPPPSTTAVALVNSLGIGLIVLLAFWLDRHRRLKTLGNASKDDV